MKSEFDFLYKANFWAMVIGAANLTLIDPSFATQPRYMSVAKFLGLVSAGFVTIQQVNRMSDKQVEVARIHASATQNPTTSVTQIQTLEPSVNVPGE